MSIAGRSGPYLLARSHSESVTVFILPQISIAHNLYATILDLYIKKVANISTSFCAPKTCSKLYDRVQLWTAKFP